MARRMLINPFSGDTVVYSARLGDDIWTLSAEQITNVLYYFFFEEIIYVYVICFAKVS